MRRLLLSLLMALYLAVLLYLTLVFQTQRRVSPRESVNIVPFRTVAHFTRVRGWEMIVNIPGNLVAFAPLGILWPLLRGRRCSTAEIAVVGMVLSVSIELSQYATGRRIADVDDVILNTLGAALGYGLLRGCWWFQHRRVYQNALSRDPH